METFFKLLYDVLHINFEGFLSFEEFLHAFLEGVYLAFGVFYMILRGFYMLYDYNPLYFFLLISLLLINGIVRYLIQRSEFLRYQEMLREDPEMAERWLRMEEEEEKRNRWIEEKEEEWRRMRERELEEWQRKDEEYWRWLQEQTRRNGEDWWR